MKIVRTPLIARRLFKKLRWNFSSEENKIYLTFDDGPHPEVTPWVLSELKKYNAKATFFCVGANVKRYPKVYQQIIDEGHSIGNHTYHHVNGFKKRTKHYLRDIDLCSKLVDSKLFRPPYGNIRARQISRVKRNGYSIIMWDVLSYDWDEKTTKEQCAKYVIDNAKAGSIIVFHDSEKAENNLKYTLPKVLEHFSSKELEFSSILTLG